jgi:hypothetical protein
LFDLFSAAIQISVKREMLSLFGELFYHGNCMGFVFLVVSFFFLFVVTCCLCGSNSNSRIFTGAISRETLSVPIPPGGVVTVEVDLNAGMIYFAIGGKSV